jgi:WXG100 family type VII secretion target
MTTYTIQTEQADYVAGEMQAITQRLGETLQQLNSLLASNLADWQGQDMDQYKPYQNQWNQAHEQMTQKAGEASAKLTQIGDYYKQGENAGAKLWQG